MSLKLLRKIPVWEISLVTLFFFTGYGISTYNQSSQSEDSPPKPLDESYTFSDHESDDFGELGKLTLQELGSAVVAADVNSDLELLELIKSESSLRDEKTKKSKHKAFPKKSNSFTQFDNKLSPLPSKKPMIASKDADKKTVDKTTVEEAKQNSTAPKSEPNQLLNPEAALLAKPHKAKQTPSQNEKINKKTAFSKVDSKQKSPSAKTDSASSKSFDPEDSLHALYSASPDVSLDPNLDLNNLISTPEELLSALYTSEQTFGSYTPPVPSQPTSEPFSLPSDPTEPPQPKANKSARKKSLEKRKQVVSYKPEETETQSRDSAEVAYLDQSTQWTANADSKPSDGDWIYDGGYDASDWMAYRDQAFDNSPVQYSEPMPKKPVSDFIGESTSIHSSLQVFAHQDNIINPPTPSSDSSTDTLDPWDERRIINTDHISQYTPPPSQTLRSQSVNGDNYEPRELEALQPQQQAWSQTAIQQSNWPQEMPQQAWTESAQQQQQQQVWPQETPQQRSWQEATAPRVEYPMSDEPLPPFLKDQSIQHPPVSSHPAPSMPVVGYPSRPAAPLPPPNYARGPYAPPARPMGWRAPPPPRPLPPPGAYGPMRPPPCYRPPMPPRPYPPYGAAPRPMMPPQARPIAPVSAPVAARPVPVPRSSDNRSSDYFM